MTAWILSHYNRAMILRDIEAAEEGSRVTLDDGPKRSNPQNRLMWKLLGYFADQVVHGDRKYDSETWKAILLKAFGKQLQFVPSLDGTSMVALGYRSSLLTKEEMANFIEFIYAEGVALGVVFDDDLSEPEVTTLARMKALPA